MARDPRSDRVDWAPQGDMSRKEFVEFGGKRLVYIRAVAAHEVADELVDEDGDIMIDLPDDAILYSVHAANGERLALVGDRALAFAAARQHEMNPVSVH